MQSRSFTSSHDLAQISSAGEFVGCSRLWNVRFTAIRRRNVSRHSRWLRISYLMKGAIRGTQVQSISYVMKGAIIGTQVQSISHVMKGAIIGTQVQSISHVTSTFPNSRMKGAIKGTQMQART